MDGRRKIKGAWTDEALACEDAASWLLRKVLKWSPKTCKGKDKEKKDDAMKVMAMQDAMRLAQDSRERFLRAVSSSKEIWEARRVWDGWTRLDHDVILFEREIKGIN